MMMKWAHRTGSMISGLTLLTVILIFGVVSAEAGAWRDLGMPSGDRTGGVSDFVIDATGALWMMARNEVYWWDGEQWVMAKDGDQPYRSGHYLAGLYGGPDRGVWMTQKGEVEHEGLLYKLESGRVKPDGKFYYDVTHNPPGLYVARSGELFNYSSRFIAVRHRGRWERVETPMGATPWSVNVADFSPDGPVVFVPRGHNVAVIWDGRTLHANVAIEGATPDNPQDPAGLVACRWGRNRLLLWRCGRVGLGACEVVANRLKAVDIQSLQEKIGADTAIYDGWGATDGSAWLCIRRPEEDRWNLVRISAGGDVVELGADTTRRLDWSGERFSQCRQCALLAKDGSVWLGLSNVGIARIRDGQVELTGWEKPGGSRGAQWVFQAPDGRIYAASDSVYRWEPDARPDDTFAKSWMEVVTTVSQGPVCGPDGCLWLFRPDLPGKVSRWDGRQWLHIDIPFPQSKVSRLAADEKGCLIVEMYAYPDGTYIIGPNGTRRYKDIHEALVVRVSEGARRFRSKGILGPVVDKQGRIWFAYEGYDYVHACFQGQWEQFALNKVAHIGLSDDGTTAWFGNSEGWWIYSRGQMVRMSGEVNKALKVLSSWSPRYRYHTVPRYFFSLPKSLRRDLLVIANTGGGESWAPVSWEEAEEIAQGRPWKPPSDLGQRPLRYPLWAIPDGEGGFWVCHNNLVTLRLRHGSLIPLDGRGTPLAGRSLHEVGFDPAGNFWANAGRYGEGHHLFIRRVPPPKMRLGKVAVTRGRIITAEWCGEPETQAIEYRFSKDQPWEMAAGSSGTLTWRAAKPGRTEVALTVRAMDSVGVLSPPEVQKVAIDVRLPRIRWADGKPPKSINEPFWRAPIEVEWAFEDVSRKIEYRIDEGNWQVLGKDHTVAVLHLNNQQARFEFRAVEEDAFVSTKTLSSPIGIEMNMSEWIPKLIEQVLHGDERTYQQAVRALAQIPTEALPVLEEHLQGRRAAVTRLTEAIQQVRQQPSPPPHRQ